jgi:alcohol dehydrogenase class IV
VIATIQAPRQVIIGGGAVTQVAEVLTRFRLKRPLVVSDPNLVRMGLVERCLDPLKKAQIAVDVYSDTIPEPTNPYVEAGVDRLAAGDYDCLIGFGGGSPIDIAKAMAILHAGGGQVRDYKAPRQNDMAALPVIAIPTTAGTGSEVTRFTVITDVERQEKMLIIGLAALPLVAIVDYELTFSVPARTTADTGIDSFTHALEAFVSRRANPYSDALALAAMETIGRHLRTAYHEPRNAAAREGMTLGATLAGLAFSNSSVALVHGMSRPIGAHFKVAHGLSNAMLLPAITRFGLDASLPRYAAAARRAGFASASAGDAEAGAALVDALAALNVELNVPTPARYGIDKAVWDAKLDLMAEQALGSGSPANNPRVPEKAEIITLYQTVWNG